MADISFVTPWLAVGGAIVTEEDVLSVLEKGITHVVNCRVGFDDKQLLRGRAAYLWDPAPDDRRPKPARWFTEAIRFTRAAMEDDRAKVLVHCTGGIDRSPSIAYAILRSMGYSEADAESAVLEGRPEARLPYRQYAEAAVKQFSGSGSENEGNVA
ncbi:MAG: hypothetical protein DLM67_00190 [Candidatus Nephthysia bennettiae]|uniref:Dual specificity protein phosphatase family protein n=1 Tax=Candidatus Nephthysia bennettiae TaxID=3127016 RepID=A0A934N2Y3_9BACT|nr:dual specificity protein phosphatase family protein [Candidatus Dormibacteraeota bacterium]MBJ7614382.1 dual specificity protein phosphatase family protein [Candidatus Dormibacteraeota bacterium]PZS00958.1 MAG: hypothetical protein DLM67_00190 [Candidatus Dormibacteraeota bacterium]